MYMKAIVVTSFGGPEVMKYTDVEMPAISDNQVLTYYQKEVSFLRACESR
ncbi:hypothetical protein P4U03_03465 [Bacillus mycoides]|nr:hypothetical protein [Bacillus mycoides]